MKLHKLYLKNINSLKGEHQIDFDGPKLSNCGIFSIIGPTGSGKSTILDAITLVLYNKVPRLSGSISDSVIRDQGVILTQYETDAKVKLEYSVDGKRYLAQWSIRTAKTGKLQPHEISIVDLATNTTLNLQKKQVPDKNAELIGLNYDQFVKSILLSQGEFSKFLKASKSDRGAILEKITGTEIYRELGKATFSQNKTQVAKLKEIEKDIANVNLASVEELKEWQTQISEFTKQIKTIDDQVALVNDQIKQEENRKKYSDELELIKKGVGELKLRKEASTTNQVRLQKHLKIEPLIPALTTLKNTKSELNNKEIRLKTDRQQNTEALIKLNNCVDQYHQSIKKNTTLKTISDDLIETKSLVDKLKISLADIAKAESNINTDIQKVRLDNPEIDWTQFLVAKNASQSFNLCDAEISILNSNIDNLPKEYKNINNADEILESTLVKKEQISKILDMKKAIEKSNITLLKGTEYLKKIATSTEKGKEKLKVNQAQIDEGKSAISKAQIQKELADRIMSMDEHRKHLIDGTPCSLCGSTSHPFALKAPKSETNWTDKINTLNKNQEVINLTKQEISKGLTTLESLKEQKEKELATAQSELAEFKKGLNTIEPSLQSSTQAELDSTDQKVKDLNLYIKTKSKLKQISLAKYYLERGIKLADEHYEKTAELKLIYSNESVDFDDFYAELKHEIQEQQQILIQTETTLNTLQKEIKSANQVITTESSALLLKAKAIQIDSIQQLISSRLTDSDKLSISTEIEEIKKEDTTLTTRLKTAEEQLSLLKVPHVLPDLQSLKQQVHSLNATKTTQAEHKGVLLRKVEENDERLKEYANHQKKLTKQQTITQNWNQLNSLIGDSKGNTYSNFAQSLTLRNLVALANIRLRDLNDRYLLNNDTSQDELEVIDLYQGSTTRSISSLSGGESFILSLALALSLSDLASKNVHLDSLFIDEGFGTLDAETLDTAMQTLEKLQSTSNKTIGVISHIESIKERINTKIVLSKNTQGHSELTIVNG